MKESELPEGVKLEWMGDRYRAIDIGGALRPFKGWELTVPALSPVTFIFKVKYEKEAHKRALQFLKSRGFK